MNSDFPHESLEAEQMLLGGLMLDNTALYDIRGTVRREDFTHPVHGFLFEKIQELVDAGKEAIPITLRPFFEQCDDLVPVGGLGYITDLARAANGTSVTASAEVVSTMAERCRLFDAVSKARQMLLDGNYDTSEIKAKLSGEMESTGKSVFVRTKRQVAVAAVQALQMPKACYKTGLHALDAAMAGGLFAGFTYGICAPQKAGKTTFAHTISHNLNASGCDHAYLALEMGSTQIEQRNLARDLGLNSMAFLSEKKSKKLVSDAMLKAHEVPDHTLYLDMPACTFAQIKSELAALVAKKKIKGFILDYWQLVGGCPPKQSKADFLYDVAQWAANFARRHGIWCLLLAQMNREGGVFGSGGLEKACDQLYMIEKCEHDDKSLWLNMKDSRYTPSGSIGGPNDAKFIISTKSGPYIEEV